MAMGREKIFIALLPLLMLSACAETGISPESEAVVTEAAKDGGSGVSGTEGDSEKAPVAAVDMPGIEIAGAEEDPGQEDTGHEDGLSEDNMPEDTQREEADTGESGTEGLTVSRDMRFVDAHEEWHEFTVTEGLLAVQYDWECLRNDENGIFYDGDERYGIQRGIDVSRFQKDIDWDRVKAAGIDFVIVRVGFRGYGSSGQLKEDERFRQNIEGAHAAGLEVGVYFFAQAVNEEEAIEEAQFVEGLLEGIDIELPVVYDPELIRDDEARTDNVSGEQFTKNTIAFCEEMRSAGYEPMIYSNMVWEAELFDMGQLQQYPFWYADYEPVPQTPYAFEYWQYSEKGRVDGISGEVDLDVRFVQR